MSEIRATQPLFPLPNAVLFPKAILTLHVFEPRYRLMMAEVLKGDQTICMALLKPGWEADYQGSPDVHAVACVGRVVQHQMLEDGRYNIALHGEQKVRIEGFEREHPFRIAHVRQVLEDLSWAGREETGRDSQEVLDLFRRFHAGQGEAIDVAQVFGAHMGPDAILNTIAMNLNVEPAAKQRLLEMESLDLRFRAVREILTEASQVQDWIERVRHLSPPDRRLN